MNPRRVIPCVRMSASTVTMLALLGPVWGCSDGKPPVSDSTEEATVSGTVHLGGKPASKGYVQFDPSNYLRRTEAVRKADVGADGTYTVKTLVGENTVEAFDLRGPNTGGFVRPPITIDVKRGTNTLDIGGGTKTSGYR
jgi:hypothetical protein